MFHLLLVIIYLSFISLGLPDGILGAAWPVIYPEMNVPVSYSGIIFMIISAGTVVSSLQSDRLTKHFGTAKVTAVSVGITMIALFGFSSCHSFLLFCLWAIPYGLGAGSVDASLNNYVALHYESKHMSWLHCMWGIGATAGPYIMGMVLNRGMIWNTGYRIVGAIQLVLTVLLFVSLPVWKQNGSQNLSEDTSKAPLRLKEIFRIPGAKEIMITFFCYCALEQTAGLWAASYLVINRNMNVEAAAKFSALFYLGITLGRFINGFIAMRLNDHEMIRMGFLTIAVGILLILLPTGQTCALIGLIIVGLGCAPVYPCIIHSTPEHFGADNSQALIGVQMASAYIGITLMPPLFGLIADHITIALLPEFLLALFLLMSFMYYKMKRERPR